MCDRNYVKKGVKKNRKKIVSYAMCTSSTSYISAKERKILLNN